MNESLNELHRKLSTLGNGIPPNYRLFIVGGLLREGTSTAYDDIAPAEIMIDNSIRQWLETCIVNLLEYTIHCDLLNINEVDEPGDTVKRYIQLDALSQLQQWKQYIETDQEISNARDFINNEDFKPKCLIAELTVGEENFTFIKVITENVLLKTRKIFKYVEARDGYILDEERNRKLFLDDQWDGIVFDHKVILYNETKLLTLFKYYEKFREAAQNVVSQLDVLEFLSSTAELYAFTESTVSLQKKLAQVSNYQIERISPERITELINEGTIDLRLNTEGKVECTTKEEAKIFIDVLLDNFVSSLITDDRYKAHNKSRL